MASPCASDKSPVPLITLPGAIRLDASEAWSAPMRIWPISCATIIPNQVRARLLVGNAPKVSPIGAKFIPTMTRPYTFSLCSPVTTFDTIMQIVALECVDGPIRGCDDEACGMAGMGVPSEIAGIVLEAGVCYYVMIDGWGGAVGPYQLDITSP